MYLRAAIRQASPTKEGRAQADSDLAHLPGGFAAEPSVQAYLHKRRNLDFDAD